MNEPYPYDPHPDVLHLEARHKQNVTRLNLALIAIVVQFLTLLIGGVVDYTHQSDRMERIGDKVATNNDIVMNAVHELSGAVKDLRVVIDDTRRGQIDVNNRVIALETMVNILRGNARQNNP